MTEICPTCNTDYEHTHTYANGNKLYRCKGKGCLMVQAFQKQPEMSEEDLADWYGGYVPWQYQWTQQLVLNQISWKVIYWDTEKAFDPVWHKKDYERALTQADQWYQDNFLALYTSVLKAISVGRLNSPWKLWS